MTLAIAALTLLLFLVLAAGWRWLLRPWFVTGFFLGGSLLLVLSAGRLDLQAFTWVKVLTLAISMQVVLWLPRAGDPWRRRLAAALAAILALNILEAVVADAFAGRWVNAVVGLSLIATMRGPAHVSAARFAGRPAVYYDLPWSWVLAYTLWNLTVVCGHYPQHWLDHFAVLTVPLVGALVARDRRLWLEARAFTLGVYAVGIVLAIDAAGMPWIPDSPSPAAWYPYWSAGAALLAVWNAGQRIASGRVAPAAQ
jgi:hypothetical protein